MTRIFGFSNLHLNLECVKYKNLFYIQVENGPRLLRTDDEKVARAFVDGVEYGFSKGYSCNSLDGVEYGNRKGFLSLLELFEDDKDKIIKRHAKGLLRTLTKDDKNNWLK